MKAHSIIPRFFFPLFAAVVVACGPAENKKLLFNGRDLEGWDVYVSASSDSTPPPGLNNDPDRVFSVVEVDGQNVMRISGEKFAGISTVGEFENFHLTLQFKWGQNKIPSFKDRKRDSGLLYYAVGPHGMDARSWMRSQEFQIQEGDCGDYWGCAGGVFDVPATKNEKNEWRYDPNGQMMTFKDGGELGRRCWKNPDGEKPTGEWNTIDLYCLGDSSVHVINGAVVMKLYRSRQQDNGVETRLAKGKIQLQSEGCEIYYRAISVEPISKMPATL